MIFRKYYPLPRFDYRNNTVLLANKTGHERVDSTITYRWENKIMKALPEYFFIQYTLSGAGIVEMNGRVHKVDKGKAFLCTQDQPYLYYHDPAISDHWEFIWFGLSGLSGQLIFKSIQRDFGSSVELSPTSKTITQMFKALEFSEREQWKSIVQISVFANTFLLFLIEDLRKANSQFSNGRMDDVLEYVRNYY
ncbi:MAG: AraC family ligand binding domain-containing protein, partial [Fibrobacteres bacterium]|nr:AraC family ligand binding domain-containing protein [Fibrobacterota bacterium]